MYTAVPHAATTAPNSHMSSDSPTLPDDRNITLGVAKILRFVSVVYARETIRDAPRPDHAVEDEERGAGESELPLLVRDVVSPFFRLVYETMSTVAAKYCGRPTCFDHDIICGALAVVLAMRARSQQRLLLVKLDVVEFSYARAGCGGVRHAWRTRKACERGILGAGGGRRGGGKNRAKWRSDDV